MLIGRWVTYTLSAQDAHTIVGNRMSRGQVHMESGFLAGHGNPVAEGMACPAVIVADNGGSVNLQVLLDGDDQVWVTSRSEGTGPGTWQG